MKSTLTIPAALLLVVATTSVANGAEAKGAAYPLATCPVSGKKLGAMGRPVVLVHEGREIRFCCAGCIQSFRKDPRPSLAKIEAAAKSAGGAVRDATGGEGQKGSCGGCGEKDSGGEKSGCGCGG